MPKKQLITKTRLLTPSYVGVLVVVLLVCLLGVTAAVGAADSVTPITQQMTENESVSEDGYYEEVPERGDPYFEAEASDGSWISYVNPRDGYRSPYLGDGSGKICVALYNQAGEPIVGESVPGTTVTIPTGDSLSWHSAADPMTVQYPLTDEYTRPLDADQFGTTDDLPQGDGYLDSHCIEFHGLPENGTISYGEVEIDGPYTDQIEVVGYIQQAHRAWDSDVDPIDDAVSYEDAGGGWTYEPDASHGQVVVVLQLAETAETDTETPTEEATPTQTETQTDDTPTDAATGEENDTQTEAVAGADESSPYERPSIWVILGLASTVLVMAVVGWSITRGS